MPEKKALIFTAALRPTKAQRGADEFSVIDDQDEEHDNDRTDHIAEY
jgi:hypothetical protein